jgi:DNA polymerase III gamma/tau subunit
MLKGFLEDPKTFPALILLQGPSGCGKTTLSRIIGDDLCSSDNDFIQMNISNTRGIGDARGIIDMVGMTSLGGGFTVIVLNECHNATTDFQNAMLEVLEEPPPNTCFVMCTTEPEKLILTIRSRATILPVRKLSLSELEGLAKKVIKRTDMNTPKPRIFSKLLMASQGSPRQLLIILNAIQHMKRDEINDYLEGNFAEDNAQISEICQAILQQRSYKEIMMLVSKLKMPVEDTRRGINNYMGKVLSNKPNPIAAKTINNLFDSLWAVGKAGLIVSIYNIVKEDD